MRNFINSTTFLAVATAILYTWGTARYHGYLITLKLDSDIMERSFHQVLYSGFLISFSEIFIFLTVITFLLFFYAHGVLPGYIDFARKGFKQKRKIITIKKYIYGSRKSPLIEINAKRRSNQYWGYFFLAMAYLFSLYYFEMEGRYLADSVIKQHASGLNKSSTMISTIINSKTATLRFLACGSKNCAGIEEQSNRIHYFPQSTGYSYTFNE